MALAVNEHGSCVEFMAQSKELCSISSYNKKHRHKCLMYN